MQFTVKVNDYRVKQTLEKLSSGVRDFSKPLNQASDKLLIFFGEDVFETQGRAINETWRVLAESTLRARAKRSGYYAQPPIETNKKLVWTGRLKKGFQKQVERLRSTISNNVKYFRYNQDTRPMLAVTDKVTAIVKKTFNSYFKKIL